MADGGLTFTIVAWGPAAARMAIKLALPAYTIRYRDPFPGMPPARPAVNKWTKLGPCVDVLLFGVLVHNIIPAAFESLKVPIARRVFYNPFQNLYDTSRY